VKKKRGECAKRKEKPVEVDAERIREREKM